MHFRFRMYLVAVLLPLLFLGSCTGGLASGGWYCADGLQCRPAAASSCCCDDAPQPTSEPVAASGARRFQIAMQCGCYFAAQTPDAASETTTAAPQFLDGRLSIAYVFELAIAQSTVDRLPEPTHDPPPLFRSPQSPRGPPVV